MNDYDIKHLMDRYIYSDRDGNQYEMNALKDLMHYAQRRVEDPDEELVRHNEYLEEKNSDLTNRINDLRAQLEESKKEKNSAQRKLKLFIKAAARLKFVEKLKNEITILVEAEKDNIKFNKFFGITTNQLAAYEEELEDLEDVN